MRWWLSGLSLFTTLNALAFSFKNIPSANNIVEAERYYELRRKVIIDHSGDQLLGLPPTPPKDGFSSFARTMLARMILQKDLAAVSENILRENFKPWQMGTDFSLPLGLCEREGDYDFVLQSLIKMAYLNRGSATPLLNQAAQNKLELILLNESGEPWNGKIDLKNCFGLTITDTENHILMVNVARYLTNQLLLTQSDLSARALYDNSQNGFDRWMSEHLAQFLREDFSEFNSRPYAGYTLLALANLYDYAQNSDVKNRAKMVLDYLHIRMAVHSRGLLRYPPFRRQKKYRDSEDINAGDAAIMRFLLHSGNYKLTSFFNSESQFVGDPYHVFMAATESYRPPEIAYKIIFDVNTESQQFLKHAGVEINYSSTSFLITAGGVRRGFADAGTGENDAQAVATTVIPTNGSNKLSQLFHIKGVNDSLYRNNLCVHRNFACGANVHVPKSMKACEVRKGRWSFFDTKQCSPSDRIFLAVYRDKNENADEKNFGFFEVHEPNIDFSEFIDKVTTQNPRRYRADPTGVWKYISSRGELIEFKIIETSLKHYPIISADGKKMNTILANWPLAQGDIINSEGDGIVTVTFKNEKLVFDVRGE